MNIVVMQVLPIICFFVLVIIIYLIFSSTSINSKVSDNEKILTEYNKKVDILEANYGEISLKISSLESINSEKLTEQVSDITANTTANTTASQTANATANATASQTANTTANTTASQTANATASQTANTTANTTASQTVTNATSSISAAVLDNIKRDIEINIMNNLNDIKSYISEDEFNAEKERISIVLKQYSDNTKNNTDLITQYRSEISTNANKILSLETKLSDIVTKTTELYTLSSKINGFNTDVAKLRDELSQAEVNLYSNITTQLLSAKNELNNNIADYYNQSALKITKLSDEVGAKVTTETNSLRKQMYDLSVQFTSTTDDLKKQMNDFISLSTSKMQSLESGLRADVTANTKAITDINNSISQIKSVIGDMDNLKYVTMLKGNVIDAIYDLNTRLSKYEGQSDEIIAIKNNVANISKLVGQESSLSSGFWDFYKTFVKLDPVLYEVSKKIDSLPNNSELLAKIASIKGNLAFSYANTNGVSKPTIYYMINTSISEISSIVNNMYYTSQSISSAEFRTYTDHINSALKELESTASTLSVIDYINNLQLSVSNLHSKRVNDENDIADIKKRISDIDLSNVTVTNDLKKSIDGLSTSISKINYNENAISDLQFTVKELQKAAYGSYTTAERFKSIETIVTYLNNYVGDWYTFSDQNIKNYIQGLVDTVNSNKKAQDSISDSLTKLKKLVGEYTLADNKNVMDLAFDAQDSIARVKSMIGNYTWSDHDNKDMTSFINSLASKTLQLESNLAGLNPANVASKISAIETNISSINSDMTTLKVSNTAFSDAIKLASKQINDITGEHYKTVNRIGLPDDEPRTVYKIMNDINARIDSISSLGTQYADLAKSVSDTKLTLGVYLDGLKNVNDYIKDVDLMAKNSSVDIKSLTGLVTSLKTSIDNLKSSVASSSSLDVINKSISDLQTITSSITADNDWSDMISSLYSIKITIGRAVNVAPRINYDYVSTNIQTIIDGLSSAKLNVAGKVNKDFYTKIDEFNSNLFKIYDKLLSFTLADASYDNAVYNNMMSLNATIKRYLYYFDTTGNISVSGVTQNMPLWYYVQKKFSDFLSTTATKSSVDDISTRVLSAEDKLKILDALSTSLKSLSDNIGTFTNSDYTKLTQRVTDVETKLGVAAASTPGVNDVINAKSPDISYTPNNIGMSTTNNQYIFTGLTITNGVITNGTTGYRPYPQLAWGSGGNIEHKIDPAALGYTSSDRIILPIEDVLGIILKSSDVTMINNKFTIMSYGNYLTPLVTNDNMRLTDNEAFIYYLLIKGWYHDTAPDAPYSAADAWYNCYNKLQTANITLMSSTSRDKFNGVPYQSSIVTINKPKILNILENMKKYSRKYNTTISICFGIQLSGQNTLIKDGFKINGVSAKLSLDTLKSQMNGVPTLVSNGLLDVSDKGFILDGIPDFNRHNYPPIEFSTGNYISYAMCPNNSYMCGVKGITKADTTNTAKQQVSVFPICCSFRKS